MSRIKQSLLSLGWIVLGSITLAPLPTLARHGPEDALVAPFVPRHSEYRRPLRNLDEAVAQIQRKTRGRILAAEESSERGERSFRIKVLMPSGRVRVFHVAAGE